jgi:hypothetical protein
MKKRWIKTGSRRLSAGGFPVSHRCLRYETEGVLFFKHIETKAVGHGHATAAHRPDSATSAFVASGTVSPGCSRIVDVFEAVQEYIADVGRKLSAGVNFSVRKKRHKIEGGAAAVPGAPPKRFDPFPVAKDVDEIVLQTDNGVGACGFRIGFEESDVLILFSKMKTGALPYKGQAVESEKVHFVAECFRKRKHLVDVVPGQGQHDHGIDAHVMKGVKIPDL